MLCNTNRSMKGSYAVHSQLISSTYSCLTLSLLVTKLVKTKLWKNTEIWLKTWRIGTNELVLVRSFPMNTRITGFSLCPCALDESSLSIRRVNTFYSSRDMNSYKVPSIARLLTVLYKHIRYTEYCSIFESLKKIDEPTVTFSAYGGAQLKKLFRLIWTGEVL